MKGLLEMSGAPVGVANQMYFIGKNLKRYIKIADSFGAVVEQTNGLGQGCSMSIVVANLYVATLFNFLQAKFPSLDLAAFLDDRNLVADDVQTLVQAIDATHEFDRDAGHTTNLHKSMAFATNENDRAALKNIKVRGEALQVKLNATIVGHDVSVKKARDTRFLSGRAAMASTRADKVSTMQGTRDQKKRIIQNAVIPSMASGAAWDLPSIQAMDGLRTSITNAVWGRGRRMRCKEILFAVLNDPIRTDPLAAIIFKRLDDTRRLMHKKPQRMLIAMHAFELTREDDSGVVIFPKGAGPVKGLRQAAAVIGGRLQVDADGFFVDFGDFQPQLHLNKGPTSSWKRSARRATQNAITRQLSSRLVDPGAPEEERRRRGARKDLYGAGEVIDVEATCACSHGKATDVVKRNKTIWEQAGVEVD